MQPAGGLVSTVSLNPHGRNQKHLRDVPSPPVLKESNPGLCESRPSQCFPLSPKRISTWSLPEAQREWGRVSAVLLLS